MKKIINSALLAIIIVCLFSSCRTLPAYYLSPLDNYSHPYHSVPLRSDSIRSAVCASGVLTVGFANDNGRDKIYGFQSDIYRSHTLENLQAYYGLGLTLGTYDVAKYDRVHYSGNEPNDTLLSIPRKYCFFGAYGFSGGINLVFPMGVRHEWRALGVETSIQKEFGNYSKFRKSLKNEGIEILGTNDFTHTVGVFTEFVWKHPNGFEMGEKVSTGISTMPATKFNGIDEEDFYCNYFSNTLHFTKNKNTVFVQLNLGSHSTGIQVGANYRFAEKRRE